MNYSQKPLIDLMKEGKFPGEIIKPKHIETVISNVFIFDTKVYKIYKNDNEFFNREFRDVSGKEARFSFTKRDFEWNHSLSPSIYTDIVGVRVRDGIIEVISPDEKAEDLVIVMNRANTNDVLFEKLISNQISKEDSYVIGKELARSLKTVQKKIFNQNYFDLYKGRVDDLRSWIKLVPEYISEEESGAYCDFLERSMEKNRELFENELSNELVADGDFHSHNAIYSGGEFLLMDTFPPKEEWGIGHHHIPVYRIGTDIWALSGKKDFFNEFIRGYEEISGKKIEKRLEDLYVVYASGIAVSYLYMLQKTDKEKKPFAERFHKFLRDFVEERKLLS
ncbi:MAG: hypothetical protein JWN37_195 [Candidatus Nomurabacteria bacterium]|nr:hypothetical protein [Candidatus Nomurabacteria bacterium]